MGSEQIGHEVCLLLLWLWFLFIVKKMKGTQGSRDQGGWQSTCGSAETGIQTSNREAISGGVRASQALAPHWPGSNLCSTTVCDLRQVMPPLWASVSLSAKMGLIIMLTTRYIGRTLKDTGCKASSKAGYHHCHRYWSTFHMQLPIKPPAWHPVTEIAGCLDLLISSKSSVESHLQLTFPWFHWETMFQALAFRPFSLVPHDGRSRLL